MDICTENREKIISLLQSGICPICGEKHVNPLLHIRKKHGITPREIRNTLLIKTKTSFIDPDLRQVMSNAAIQNNKVLAMAGVRPTHPSPTRLKSISARQNGKHIDNKKAIVKTLPSGEIKIYKSMIEAGADNNVHYSTISLCIKENRLDKKGNKWSYKGED